MYPRFAFALLFSVCAFGLGIAIPAFPDQQCGPNAEFRECGSACVPNCAHPEPPKVCTLQCIRGCFCKEGFLMTAQGECVRPQECDAHHPRIPMQKPFAFPPQCPDNEEFQTCGTACPATCDNPTPSGLCTKNCVIGCFCKQGHLRSTRSGLCMPAHQCEAKTSMLFAYPQGYEVPQVPVQECSENEEFRQCKGCDGTCDKPNPICPRICVAGCACKEGHLRAGSNGRCIKVEQCPKVDQVEAFVVPKCGENMEFRTCGSACPATCASPIPPAACTRNCVIGCFCKEGFFKNVNGECVQMERCVVPEPFSMNIVMPEGKCPTDREIHTDCGAQLDCMASCDTPLPFMIRGVPQIPKKCLERKCTPGCSCMKPYARNSMGKCVLRSECHHETPLAGKIH